MPATIAVDFGSRPLPDPRMPATTAVGSRPLPDPRMPATTAVDFGSRPLPDPRMPATTAVDFGSRPLPDPRMPATTAVDVRSRPVPDSRSTTTPTAAVETDVRVTPTTTSTLPTSRDGGMSNMLDPLSLSMLAHQLPSLPKFSGDSLGDEEEGIREWLERLEMVASACAWTDQVKLVNLITRLRGSAYSFFRSCTPTQRSSYESLKDALLKRFTPVHLRSVKSSQFHERKQRQDETVDSFAQELKRLFYKAYPSTQQGSPEAEAMGRAVLSSQFVAGLRADIKAKVAGVDGDFDELLTKARFEEARFRDFNPPVTRHSTPNVNQRIQPRKQSSTSETKKSNEKSGGGTPRKCFSCGSTKHLIANCPQKRRGASVESRGRKDANVATISQRPAEKKKEDDDAKPEEGVEEILSLVAATLHGVSATNKDSKLGVVPTAEIVLEGFPVCAVLDTGSPVTIVSMMQVLAENKPEQQTPEEWKADTRKRLKKPSVTLHSYGGGELPILCEAVCVLSRGSFTVEAVLQVQRDAPVDMLLGTDIQPQLGFALVQQNKPQVNLLLPGGTADSEETGMREAEQDTPVPVGTPEERESVQDARVSVVTETTEPEQDACVSVVTETTEPEQDAHALVETGTRETEKDAPDPVETPAERESVQDAPVIGTRETEEDSPDPVETPVMTETRESATVCLLKATRVPARHSKLVRAQIDTSLGTDLAVFEPAGDLEEGLCMLDAAVQPKSDQSLTLIIQNAGCQPVWLKKGQVLGKVEPASLVEVKTVSVDDTESQQSDESEDSEPDELESSESQQCDESEQQEESEEDRGEQLLSSLGFGSVAQNLSEEEVHQLRELVLEFSDVFTLEGEGLGCTDRVTHSIDTGDHPPVRQPPRRIPFALRQTVREMVEAMLERGIVQPSSSPWSSPVVIVSKKDGTKRFCVDYRKLNAITKMDAYPLPRIDDALDMLANKEYFTSLDLISGYWQVKMADDSVEKTAFSTPDGLFEFTVMHFGLCNAPATFQRLMEAVLEGLIPEKCLIYIDDSLVSGKTFGEHLRNLREVLTRLREACLTLKPKKCRLCRLSVEYLGFVVSKMGISADPKKVKAVQDFPTPLDLKSLRSFLGLASYCRRFIPCFSSIGQPLHALTKKDAPFVWTGSCEEAFNQLKNLLTTAPILVYPDFEKEFFLETDASGSGLGAVLTQVQEDGLHRPIAYASRTLQDHERNYGITELEALGVVWAVKHFRHYLYGHRCTVITDHEALKSLLNTPHPSGKLARWGMVLQELDLHIVYRPGKQNAKADALSRYPVEDGAEVTTMPFTLVAAITQEAVSAKDGDPLSRRQEADPVLKPLMKYLDCGAVPEDKTTARKVILESAQYALLEGVLYHVEKDKSLRVVPPSSDREKLFNEAHGGQFGGHLRDAKVHGQLSRHYWWPGMRKDIRQWCLACIPCATRSVGRQIRPPLTPIPVSGPFDRVGVDVIQFPKSKRGNRYALVFMDYLTKWPEVSRWLIKVL